MGQIHYTGIVLAGGKSSRMGQDKGLMLYKGIPLVQHSINLLSQYCSDIIISSNNSDYNRFGYTVVTDIFNDKGPMGGIYSALLSAKNDRCIVIGCDMPNLNQLAIKLLVGSLSDDFDFNIARHHHVIEPLFGIYSAKSANLFLTAINNDQLKLHRFLASQRTLYVDFDQMVISNPSLFSNINAPSDL